MAGRSFGSKTVRYRSALVRNRDRTYSVKVQVPAELREEIGAEELRFFLDTKILEEASFLLPFIAHDIARGLDRFRAEKLSAELDGNALRLGSSAGRRPDPKARDQILADILKDCASVAHIQPDQTYPLDDYETRRLLRTVDNLIVDFEIPLKRYTQGYWRLAGRIDRLQRLLPAPPQRGAPVPRDEAAALALRETSIHETLGLFEADFGHSWSPASRLGHERLFSDIIQLFGGDRQFRAVARADLRYFRDIQEDLAPNWKRHSKLRHLPIQEAAKRSRELGLKRRTPQTLRQIMTRVSTIMDFAMIEGIREDNCARQLSVGLAPHTARRPHPLTLPQLQAVFKKAPLYSAPIPLEARGGLFWLPLLGLWTGWRLSECAQIRVTDVAIVEGIPVIWNAEEGPFPDPHDDKRVKTKYSTRVVPIHPQLQRLGFVKFWQYVQTIPRDRLFPELRREGPTQTFYKSSRFLTRFIRSATHGDPRTSFRSFRHNFRDSARDADLPKDRVSVLGGWSDRDTSDRYGIGGAIPRLYRDIQKIEYPGLDLSHLEI